MLLYADDRPSTMDALFAMAYTVTTSTFYTFCSFQWPCVRPFFDCFLLFLLIFRPGRQHLVEPARAPCSGPFMQSHSANYF